MARLNELLTSHPSPLATDSQVDQHAVCERRLLNEFVSRHVRDCPDGKGVEWDGGGGEGRWRLKEEVRSLCGRGGEG